MKTTMIKKTGILLVAILMVSGIEIQAQGGRGNNSGGRGYGPCGEGFGPGGQRYSMQGDVQRGDFACLDLSEAQQEELKALRLENYKTMKPLNNQMAELRLKKRTLMSEDDVDLNAINKVIDEQSTLSAKIQKLRASHRVEAKTILTEEQQMLLDQRMMRNGKRQGRGMHARRPMQQGRR